MGLESYAENSKVSEEELKKIEKLNEQIQARIEEKKEKAQWANRGIKGSILKR